MVMHDRLRQSILQLLDDGCQQQGVLERLETITNCWQQIEQAPQHPPRSQHPQCSSIAAMTESPHAQSYEVAETLDEEELLLYGALAQATYLLVMEVLVDACAQPTEITQLPQTQSEASSVSISPPGRKMQEAIKQAESLLHKMGYGWRLSDNVWAAVSAADYETNLEGCDSTINTTLTCGIDAPIVWESALPAPMLAALQTSFSIESPFWSDHCYHSGETPFFSYVYDVSQQPVSIVEAAAQHMRQQPALKDVLSKATHVEWWAHIREADTWAASAHQLHFDCDERRLRKGRGAYKLVHPIYSSVLFLTTPTLILGPTLIIHQIPGQPQLADVAWAVQPVAGRYLMFPGNLLHGVLPGRLQATQAQDKSACKSSHIQQQQQQRVPRTTLMLAWWKCCEDMQHYTEMPGAYKDTRSTGSNDDAVQLQPALEVNGQELGPWMTFPSVINGIGSELPRWAVMFSNPAFVCRQNNAGPTADVDVIGNENRMKAWLPQTIRPAWQPILKPIAHEACSIISKVDNIQVDNARIEQGVVPLSSLPGDMTYAIQSSLPGLRFFLMHDAEFNDLYPV